MGAVLVASCEGFVNPSAMASRAVRAPTVAPTPTVMGFFDKKEEAPKGKKGAKKVVKKAVKKTVKKVVKKVAKKAAAKPMAKGARPMQGKVFLLLRQRRQRRFGGVAGQLALSGVQRSQVPARLRERQVQQQEQGQHHAVGGGRCLMDWAAWIK